MPSTPQGPIPQRRNVSTTHLHNVEISLCHNVPVSNASNVSMFQPANIPISKYPKPQRRIFHCRNPPTFQRRIFPAPNDVMSECPNASHSQSRGLTMSQFPKLPISQAQIPNLQPSQPSISQSPGIPTSQCSNVTMSKPPNVFGNSKLNKNENDIK